MVLFTHEIIGGALAVATNANPVGAFFLGLASHYLSDMIPHWHYKVMRSGAKAATQWEETGKAFLSKSRADLMPWAYWKGAFDITGGVVCMILFAYRYDASAMIPIIAAMGGSILPDMMTFVSKVWPQRYLVLHTKIHLRYIHTKTLLDDRPLLGIGSQVLIALVALLSAFVFR